MSNSPAIVGIGASAGGLKALQLFFDALPHTTGMAFVVISHLHPEQESRLAEILQDHTKLRVSQVTRKVHVEPDHVYVIPPNRSIVLVDGEVDVQEFDEPRGLRTPIDHFFRSLAKADHEIVGIILSGSGTDGAVGIKAIKEVGGLLLVQAPDEAEYDGMPRAAIDTGLVDVVLPASELAVNLIRYLQHPKVVSSEPENLTFEQQQTMQRILAHVNVRTGHDFRHYKQATVMRRIQRRMQLSGHEALEEYQNYLHDDPNEAMALFNDILIGVTNFFRDVKSWEVLSKTVIPALFAEKKEGDSVRVWSVGCSTGEEAYTLGILLSEHAATLDRKIGIQIFASDLDDRALVQAREGIYPSAIEADVSKERLEMFFTPHNNYYQVNRELRDLVLFARHSVLSNPPFSKIDLISCRNLLIYIQRDLQEMLLDTFHYALNPHGYLFLGSSESAELVKELFHTVDKTHRIYQAKPWVGKHPHVPVLPLRQLSASRYENATSRQGNRRRNVNDMPDIDRHLKALETIGPASIWVDEDYAILNLSESAGRYLIYPGGPVTSDLLAVVRPELKVELRSALFQAFEKGKSVVTTPVSVSFDGGMERIIISILPDTRNAKPDWEQDRRALVIFLKDETATGEEVQGLTTEEPGLQGNEQLHQLQSEVQHLRSRIQALLEESNNTNEEMKAANEELQSVNEEFRSAMEELETSREELQSVNEELQTVNNELRTNVEEISRAHSDLENLMDATQIATLFLDRELKIKRYSPGMEHLFSIKPTDRGRHISDFTHKLGYQGLVDDARTVLETMTTIERESTSPDKGSMLIRLLPYRTVDKKIDGIVISFVDITELKNSERMRRNYQSFYVLFHGSPVPTLLTREEDNIILNANQALLSYLTLSRDEVVGHRAEEFNVGTNLELKDTAFIDKTLWRDDSFNQELTLPSGEIRSVLIYMQQVRIEDVNARLYTFVDITDRVQAELANRRLNIERKNAEHKERHRIAQLLHDDLQQRLFAVKIYVNKLEESPQDNNGQLWEANFARIREWMDQAISMTRQLGADLSPLNFRDGDLIESILSLSSQMKDRYGLEIVLESNDFQPTVDAELQMTLFHAIQELLFNIVKHSNSLKGTISLEQVNKDWAQLIVSDSGKGFDVEKTLSERNRGRGLRSIQQELQLFGAHLDVESGVKIGTRMIIRFPTPNSESQP